MVLSAVLISLYYGLFYYRLGTIKKHRLLRKNDNSTARKPLVSVVIVAHNDAAFLKESMPYLLEQDYPDYEVVVVDYLSHDDTQFVLQVCSENYPNLKPVRFPEDVNMFQGKKYPLSIGIKSAKGDILLLTDPECVPKSFGWISEMVAHYLDDATQMVMGYAGIKQESNILNAFSQYDNLADAASWMGAALLSMPYTATGRNLSYRRDFFFRSGAFVSHYSEPDGADDMFVNQNVNKSNFGIALDGGSFVTSEAKPTYRQFRQLRQHRISTKRYYSFAQKMLCAFPPILLFLLLASAVVLFVQGVCPWYIPAAVLAVKAAWQIVAFSRVTKRFEVKTIHLFAPLFEIYFLIANTIYYLFALSKKNIKSR